MRAVRARHDAPTRAAIAEHGGRVVKMLGDGFARASILSVSGRFAFNQANFAAAQGFWERSQALDLCELLAAAQAIAVSAHLIR